MSTRRSPRRHIVRGHSRSDVEHVPPYVRGEGVPIGREQKIVGSPSDILSSSEPQVIRPLDDVAERGLELYGQLDLVDVDAGDFSNFSELDDFLRSVRDYCYSNRVRYSSSARKLVDKLDYEDIKELDRAWNRASMGVSRNDPGMVQESVPKLKSMVAKINNDYWVV